MIKRHDSIIVQHISHMLIPFILIFAFYVFFHGHYSPGGGFQAGVLIAASIILKLLVGTNKERKHFSMRVELLIGNIGMLIFLGLGILSLFNNSELLNYEAVPLLGHDNPERRYYGILIAEVGVALVVSMTLVLIFHLLALTPDEGDSE